MLTAILKESKYYIFHMKAKECLATRISFILVRYKQKATQYHVTDVFRLSYII